MLRIKTKVKENGKKGLGLFADQFVPKGTITWQYDPQFDTNFSQSDVDQLSDVAKEWFMVYAYFDHERGFYVLCSDNQRYINHSEHPNIESTPDCDVASRDIEIGEELTCDYAGYEHDWFERRGLSRADFVE